MDNIERKSFMVNFGWSIYFPHFRLKHFHCHDCFTLFYDFCSFNLIYCKNHWPTTLSTHEPKTATMKWRTSPKLEQQTTTKTTTWRSETFANHISLPALFFLPLTKNLWKEETVSGRYNLFATTTSDIPFHYLWFIYDDMTSYQDHICSWLLHKQKILDRFRFADFRSSRAAPHFRSCIHIATPSPY